MTQFRPGREVYVVGVGLHSFGTVSGAEPVRTWRGTRWWTRLRDSGVPWPAIPVAYFGHVYYHGMSVGETTLAQLGLTGVPIINVENACSSGSTAFWQAYWGITSGVFDLALAFGAEKVPGGPVTVTAEKQPGPLHRRRPHDGRLRPADEALHGGNGGAGVGAGAGNGQGAAECVAEPVRAPQGDLLGGGRAELAPHRRPADAVPVLPHQRGGSRGRAVRRRRAGRPRHRPEPAIRIAAAALTSGSYNGRGSDHSAFSPYRTEPAALQAYEMAGIGPEDVDIVQVHDAATIGELQQVEALHLFPYGEAWQATVEGRTALTGDIPVNTDGGLLAMGHPFGATGIRQVHETVTQLRGEAGPRQVEGARVGVAQCSGAGDVTTPCIS